MGSEMCIRDRYGKGVRPENQLAFATGAKLTIPCANARIYPAIIPINTAAFDIKPFPKNLHIKATITTAPATLQCIREPKLSASIWNFAAPPAAYLIATGIK